MDVNIQGDGESEQLGGGESESGGDREDATLLFLFHDSPRHVCSNHQSMKMRSKQFEHMMEDHLQEGRPRGGVKN